MRTRNLNRKRLPALGCRRSCSGTRTAQTLWPRWPPTLGKTHRQRGGLTTADRAHIGNLTVDDQNINELEHLSEYTSLTELNVMSNNLSYLHELPSTLQELLCAVNNIEHLPVLPRGLRELWCANNLLINLPDLPNQLEHLGCNSNPLTFIPTLPPQLKSLFCYDCRLMVLPTLPETLEKLSCSNNQLTELPLLPESLQEITYYGNPFSANYRQILEEWLANHPHVEVIREQADHDVPLEIHTAAGRININKLKDIFRATIGDRQYTSVNIGPQLAAFMGANSTMFDDLPRKQQELDTVVQKLIASRYSREPDNIELMGLAVDYVLAQPPNFVAAYIDAFIQDCAHAYTGDSPMSCVHGIIERTYLSLYDALRIICPTLSADCLTPSQQMLAKVFDSVDLPAEANKWFEIHADDPSINERMSAELKNKFIADMKMVYVTSGALDFNRELNDETNWIVQKINNYANTLDYAFNNKLQLGGNKPRRRTRRRRKRRRVKLGSLKRHK
jgi:hypothetical protein